MLKNCISFAIQLWFALRIKMWKEMSMPLGINEYQIDTILHGRILNFSYILLYA